MGHAMGHETNCISLAFHTVFHSNRIYLANQITAGQARHGSTSHHLIIMYYSSFPAVSLIKSLRDPLVPLTQQQYFHGTMSRNEAEALLEHEGDFLIRVSNKMPGQVVLTGLASGKPQHMLLINSQGKVSMTDWAKECG